MDFSEARKNMVWGQLEPNKVTGRALLSRFENVDREFFVDMENSSTPYADKPVSIGYGRSMFSPLACARMLQSLDLQESDNLLIVAAGTGYSSVVAAPLVKQVVAVEEDANLKDVMKRAVSRHNYGNVHIVSNPPEEGYVGGGSYDKIMIDAPLETVPAAIIKQLREGGLLAAAQKNSNTGVTEVIAYTKMGKTLFEQKLLETSGEVLPNFSQGEQFVF